ncbi:hypothetical protein FA13DRAFT_1817648 [Coprinellus micaceus]|uniref:Nephrocystin 3-like N-terminal domain-containing protein n=1 Tax=Coprinellus micaceus TaxID=71717 RepID=A0A4Y7SST6_COPMI|nr:hypothetical protein FA13DRAFT_1817648 [Coprinellus micaceus]
MSPTGGYSMGRPSSSIISLLDPILDASHTRNRRTSPPNSDCFPGTRKGVLCEINSWATSSLLDEPRHILWVFGYAGCGKSAIAQSLAVQLAENGRLGGSFFFFRGAGNRSRIRRFPATIASQIALAIPGTAQHIENALRHHPGLLEPTTSPTFQFKCLVFEPIRAATAASCPSSSFVIIIDGFDECEDKGESSDFIKDLIGLFERHPDVPLRFLITSRVEDHIHRRLHNSNQVRLLNLADRTSDGDIGAALDAAIEDAKGSRILASIGEWLSSANRRALIKHIGGSFIFLETIVTFLFDPLSHDGLTPIERLPLALNMNPGFDGLYKAILERSQHFPYFSDIISTIALARNPLSISEIAQVLSITPVNVVNVLVSLHAIFQVPGDDHTPVTLWHTSLRDFLCSEDRSGPLFASPWHHRQLAYWYITMAVPCIEALGPASLEACHHWRMFLEPVRGLPELLQRELCRIMAHLEKTFPAVFPELAAAYFRLDPTSLRRKELIHLRDHKRFGGDCPRVVKPGVHPWFLIEDILDSILATPEEDLLLAYLQQSHSHLFDIPHHLDMVMYGFQILVEARPSDGAPVLRTSWYDRLTHHRPYDSVGMWKYMLSSWPRHLALAIQADVKHTLFDPITPSPIPIKEEWSPFCWAHRRLRNFDDLPETSNLELAERRVQRIVGQLTPLDVDAWEWTVEPKLLVLKKACRGFRLT